MRRLSQSYRLPNNRCAMLGGLRFLRRSPLPKRHESLDQLLLHLLVAELPGTVAGVVFGLAAVVFGAGGAEGVAVEDEELEGFLHGHRGSFETGLRQAQPLLRMSGRKR